MVEPIITAAAITAGAGLAGSMLGGGGDVDYKEQRRMMKKRIQWSVKDAQAAGIHPLYALGGGYAPSPVPSTGSGLGEGITRAGEAIGRGVAAKGAADERRATEKGDQAMAMSLHGAQLNKLVAETDFINQQAEASRVKLLEGAINQTGIGRGINPTMPPPPPPYSGIQVGKGKVYHHDPNISDTDIEQQRIGEMADFTYGPWVALKDHYYNMMVNRYNDSSRYVRTPPGAWGGPNP